MFATFDWRDALNDLLQGARSVALWSGMGWIEVRRRYKRTVLGPFWSTASTAIFVTALGILWSQFWNIEPGQYLPYLTAGFLIWLMFSSNVTEGCNTFISSQQMIMQAASPLTIYIIVVLWRNLLIYFHNILVFVVLLFIYPSNILDSLILFIPGLVLFILNCFWIALVTAIVSTRYRDVPTLISNILQISFFVTPIVWPAEAIEGKRTLIIELNPIYHLIEIVRAPLLGSAPTLTNWVTCIVMMIFGWLVGFALLARFKKRIPYWL